MKILELLAQDGKKDTATKKLSAVTTLVDNVRGVYGNEDAEITAVKVNSTEGLVSVNLLTSDEKVAVATQAIKRAISRATVIAENTEGAVFDRAFESIVACDPILTNLSMKSDSAY